MHKCQRRALDAPCCDFHKPLSVRGMETSANTLQKYMPCGYSLDPQLFVSLQLAAMTQVATYFQHESINQQNYPSSIVWDHFLPCNKHWVQAVESSPSENSSLRPAELLLRWCLQLRWQVILVSDFCPISSHSYPNRKTSVYRHFKKSSLLFCILNVCIMFL